MHIIVVNLKYEYVLPWVKVVGAPLTGLQAHAKQNISIPPYLKIVQISNILVSGDMCPSVLAEKQVLSCDVEHFMHNESPITVELLIF